jgi:hypothetical protein
MATLATGLITTIVLSSKTSSIISSVGTNLIVGTITTTTSSICSLISYFASSQHTGIIEILNLLNILDLEFTIDVIDELVRELRDKNTPESVRKALFGIADILELLHMDLNTIKDGIDNHNSKYLSNWRSFSWEGNLDVIRGHCDTLRNRYGILFELLKIYGVN